MAKAKKKKRNKRTPQQLEKMRQKQREAMERNTLKNKKRIEEAIKKRKKNKQSFLNKKDMKNLQKVYANTSQKDVVNSSLGRFGKVLVFNFLDLFWILRMPGANG